MINHTGHPHPSTPKARALCRANGGTGDISKKGTDVPKSTKKASVGAKAKPVRPIQDVKTGKTISRQAAADIMFGTKPKQEVKLPAKKAPVKRPPALSEPKIPVAKVDTEKRDSRLEAAIARIKAEKAKESAPVPARSTVPIPGSTEKVQVTQVKVGDRVRGNLVGGFHTVDKIVTNRTDLKIRVGQYSLRDKDGREFFIGATQSKVTREVNASETVDDFTGVTGTDSIPNNNGIQKSMRGGVVSARRLGGGAVGETELVTFADGTKGVRKKVTDDPDMLEALEEDGVDLDLIKTSKEQQDAEELASMFARMIGLKAPQISRVDKDTVIMEHMDGRVATTIPRSSDAELAKYGKTDQGMLVGLLDQVIGNEDRNHGNWIVDKDDNLAVIDHGISWSPETLEFDVGGGPVIGQGGDPFATNFIKIDPRLGATWKDNDMHPADLDLIAQRLTTLRPEFNKRGQQNAWKYSMAQIENLKKYAKGTKRRVR